MRSTINNRPPGFNTRRISRIVFAGSLMKCATRNNTAASSVSSSIGNDSIVPMRSSTFGVRREPRLRHLKHRSRLVDRDHPADIRCKRFGDMSGAAAQIANDPRLVEQPEQGDQVGPRADHLDAELVPRTGVVRVEEVDLRLVPTLWRGRRLRDGCPAPRCS
jgi:hypothetical protein